MLLALGVPTFVTWQLLIRAADDRMRSALLSEVTEFGSVVDDGINPRTGLPFASIDQVLEAAIAYNTARPNEKSLSYVDGVFAFQSGRADGTPEILAPDERFTALVGAVPAPVQGTYDSVAA